MPYYDPGGRKGEGRGEKEGKRRGDETGEEEERRGGRGERRVVPSTQGWNKQSTASQNTTQLLSYFGNCGRCPFTPRLSFPTQLTTHAHTHTHTHTESTARSIIEQRVLWASGLTQLQKKWKTATYTNQHKSSFKYLAKDHWTFEKNQTGGKRKTRKKKQIKWF